MEPEQELLVDTAMATVWRQFVVRGVLSGGIDIPNFFSDVDRYTAAEWQPNGFPWIDPLKESKAFGELWSKRMITWKEIAATRGRHWRHVADQWLKEAEYMESKDPTFVRPDPSGGTPSSDDDDSPPSEERTAKAEIPTGNGRAILIRNRFHEHA